VPRHVPDFPIKGIKILYIRTLTTEVEPLTVDSVIMADELAGQTANLHLDEVTGERVRSVPDPTHLACGFH